jgi:D-glycero-D-manno-heptose 1,7-bisphosphate phosphatase
MMTVPILFLDLDGTVRKGFDELGRFVNGPEDVEVFPEVPSLLARYRRDGWRIVGVSNQGGIALGHVSEADVHAAMDETQRQVGGLFDSIVFCPHHPGAGDPLEADCWCRKPRVGMLVNAAVSMARKHPDEFYQPRLALMVGGHPEDEECARNAGVAFRWAADWRKERAKGEKVMGRYVGRSEYPNVGNVSIDAGRLVEVLNRHAATCNLRAVLPALREAAPHVLWTVSPAGRLDAQTIELLPAGGRGRSVGEEDPSDDGADDGLRRCPSCRAVLVDRPFG